MQRTRKLSNWLQAYGEFTEGSESPSIFHAWVGLSMLAGAMQRKLYMDAGYFQVHSNMYVVLVAPPGRSRKTTALMIGKRILKSVIDYGQDINFSTQASSVAALVKQMAAIPNKDHQSLTAISLELGSLLGSKSTEMVDFLVDIFDCNPDWDKQTVSRGMEKIENPWLNLIAATTTQWMGDNMSSTIVEGGFVGRTIFVFADVRKRIAFPELTEEQKRLRIALAHDLAHISSLKGQFVFTPDAKEAFRYWYEEVREDELNMDPRLAGYYERKHIYVLKLAMALRIAQEDSFELQEIDVKTALEYLRMTEPGMHKAFSAVGKNIHSTELMRIKDQIQASPRGMTYKQVLAANIHSADRETIDKLLASLEHMGEISIEKGGLYVSSTKRQAANEA
jgi:hypothetical protein